MILSIKNTRDETSKTYSFWFYNNGQCTNANDCEINSPLEIVTGVKGSDVQCSRLKLEHSSLQFLFLRYFTTTKISKVNLAYCYIQYTYILTLHNGMKLSKQSNRFLSQNPFVKP